MGTISDALSSIRKCSFFGACFRAHLFYAKKVWTEKWTHIQIVRSDSSTLSFPNNSFELVVLNRILEWLPLSERKKNPKETQLENLKKMYGIIKTNGFLYIGIENRTY